MGSSAASAAAAQLHLINCLDLKLMEIHLVEFAGSGEKASAGSVHYDNVAASVLGGFVIVKTNPLECNQKLNHLLILEYVAVPKLKVPKRKPKFQEE